MSRVLEYGRLGLVLEDINLQLQALLAVTLIIGAISGGITWIAGQVAMGKLKEFKIDLLRSLDEKYVRREELVDLKEDLRSIRKEVGR